MRITGGEWGGLSLQGPKSDATRPTSDSARESLFNILSHGLGHDPQNVLDLFAGTGALSFECLSRGAESCILVESDAKARKVIELNREKLPLSTQNLHIVTEHALERWPAVLGRLNTVFDTVFCDPPYNKGLVLKAFKNLEKTPKIFAPKALLVVEISSKEEPPKLKNWEVVKDRSRGATTLLFYRRSE